MKTAIIIGATGLVGSSLTKLLIDDTRYEKIRILVREKINLEHPKLEQIVFNYENPDHNVIKGDEIYCCLGTTIKKAGSQSAFKKVDYEYPIKIASFAKTNGINKFGIISSMGASSKSSIFYNRVKGETEEALTKLSFGTLYLFRPSLLIGKREEFRLGEIIAIWVMTLFSIVIPAKYKGIKSIKVAKAMIHYMNQTEKGAIIIESDKMWRL